MGLERLEQASLGIRCTEIGSESAVSSDLDRRLASFYAAHLTEAGDVTLGESRGGSFSRLLRLRSEKSFILRAESEGAIKGVASVCVRPGYISGERRMVAYLGDLRIEFERDLLRGWRGIYGELLAALREWPTSEGVAGCLTAVVSSNERAIRALIEPHRLSPYRYQPLADIRVVNILAAAPLGGLWRWSRTGNADEWRVVSGGAGDLDRIIAFLDAQHRRRQFGECFAVELPRRLRAWPEFSLERFLIIEDQQGRIRGTVAPWAPGEAKRWFVESLPTGLRWLRKTLGRLPRTPMYRAPRLAREGESVEALFLTHLELDFNAPRGQREIWLECLIRAAMDRHADEKWNSLTFVDYESDSLQGALRGLYCHSVKASLFSVHGLDERGGLLSPLESGEFPPAFELAIF